MKTYFEFFLKQECHHIHVDKFRHSDFCSLRELCPNKLQWFLTFLACRVSTYGTAKTLASWLLQGWPTFNPTSREDIWGNHDQESWERLNAIVHGLKTDLSNESTFLELYLKTLLLVEGCKGNASAEKEGGEAFFRTLVDRYKWSDHLGLVARFAPYCFMEQNKTTGNTFLNRLIVHRTNRNIIHRVLECNVEAIHKQNIRGQTPLGVILQNMTSSYGLVDMENLRCCSTIVERCPAALTSGTAVSTKDTTPVFLVFVRAVVSTIIDGYPGHYSDRIRKITEAFINQIAVDGCCNKIVDRSGNTGLHIATKIIGSYDCRVAITELVRILKCLMTGQASLPRNSDGKRAIDIAMEGHRPDWVVKVLVKHAPPLLECRNHESGLYPFQVMASHDQLSECYSFLRMAPHLVAAGATEETTVLLESREFIDSSRLRLQLEREWVIGMRNVRDLDRVALEEQERVASRKRKSLRDAELLEDIAKNRMRISP